MVLGNSPSVQPQVNRLRTGKLYQWTLLREHRLPETLHPEEWVEEAVGDDIDAFFHRSNFMYL